MSRKHEVKELARHPAGNGTRDRLLTDISTAVLESRNDPPVVSPTIQRIDRRDAQVQKAIEAEQRLFAHYGLEYKEHYIEVEDPNIRVRVLEVGSGPPVLMVPGGNGISTELVPLMAELPDRRLIAINLPGGGMSDGIDFRQVDYRALAVAVLTAVLDAIEVERVPVVTNSIGATWMFWLALARPERISRMVQTGCPAFLFGTSAPLPMRLLSVPLLNRLLFPMAQPGNPDEVRSTLRMLLGSSREATQALPDVFVETFYQMFHLPTYRLASLSFLETVLTLRGSKERYQLGADDLSRIEQAVLFIWGENDPFGSVNVGRRAVQAMPDARLEVAETGHVPYIDAPKACARFIRDFLSQSR